MMLMVQKVIERKESPRMVVAESGIIGGPR
jgi:hypothetical protein